MRSNKPEPAALRRAGGDQLKPEAGYRNSTRKGHAIGSRSVRNHSPFWADDFDLGQPSQLADRTRARDLERRYQQDCGNRLAWEIESRVLAEIVSRDQLRKRVVGALGSNDSASLVESSRINKACVE
jgi:hypothetical protein